MGVGHIGWPSQPAQGRLSTKRLGRGWAKDRLHWTGSGGVGHTGGLASLHSASLACKVGRRTHHMQHWAGSGCRPHWVARPAGTEQA